ncbi:response regulator [Alteromonas pelagimontana]|uniref:Response regulator n=1 Tax=Alteromonas pelagimontana TaxID=1858656 RepID=A0A6M4MHK2_9ALTE|nr:response regulator [Alteromonas pelagimontana]QJR82553.1 response regulator [Alteromonas pelagimontana]
MIYRVAIVEDNATARSNIRSNLLPMGLFEISSFSNGNELKAALRRQDFEIIIFDYHLGQSKTGVEWVQTLRQSQFLKPSTGIIFITSDRLPQTVGKIIDVHPDLLLIKPYNIATLCRSMKHYLAYRSYVSQVLHAMDTGNLKEAIEQIEKLRLDTIPEKLKSEVLKLQARLYYQAGNVTLAGKLYESVLQQSEKVLWAQWGKIKCQYVAGNWADCKDQLNDLLSSSLARDKAFEWLACLCFEQEAYAQAEFYLDHIKVSELSGPASRLKSMTYQRQERSVEGIELLQRKREYHRSARDRFNEFTFDLAEFYLNIAEQQPIVNRAESLLQARRLIGIAGRNKADQQLTQKRDYLLAYSAVLEGDQNKVEQLLNGEYMEVFIRTDTPTLITAAKVNSAIGRMSKARELLTLAHERNQDMESLAEQISNHDTLTATERQMGLATEQAAELNDSGSRLFVQKDYIKAMLCFYQAFTLVPGTSAFGLNLLQCMIESRHAAYRTFTVSTLVSQLTATDLSASNQQRLAQLRAAVMEDEAFFLQARTINMAPADPPSTAAQDKEEEVIVSGASAS